MAAIHRVSPIGRSCCSVHAWVIWWRNSIPITIINLPSIVCPTPLIAIICPKLLHQKHPSSWEINKSTVFQTFFLFFLVVWEVNKIKSFNSFYKLVILSVHYLLSIIFNFLKLRTTSKRGERCLLICWVAPPRKTHTLLANYCPIQLMQCFLSILSVGRDQMENHKSLSEARAILVFHPLIKIPVGKLYESASFPDWYFNRGYFAILRERLS